MPRELVRRGLNDQPLPVDPGFVQQGQVDWVSLSSAVVSLTVGSLTRLSGAGVQEITYVGALQLATRFQLADVGYRRVCEAIEKTQVASAFGNVAYFGFGYRSFIHMLADTVVGTKCIALCATLSEAHSEDLAARIVGSLWTAVGYPEDYKPSIAQFKCLVKACAGVLAQSSFPVTVGLMLGPYRNFVRERKLPETSDPDNIARALQGLFDLSKGVRSRITVVGGAECSFIAALFQWLFDFKIHVEDSRGETLFLSSPGRDQVQVHVIYKQDDYLSTIVVSESTFVLGSPHDLLRYVPDSRLRLIRARVAWDTCLSRTFGRDFTDLLELPISLGGFLGGAARIYHALARAESEVGGFSRELFINFVDSSYGRGFAESAAKLFAELRSPVLLDTIHSVLLQSVEEACSTIEEAMIVFETKCSCVTCTNSVLASNRTGTEARLCLRALAATLLELISSIASIDFAPELLPTENGLFHIYERHERLSSRHWGYEPMEQLGNVLGLEKDAFLVNTGKRNPSVVMTNAICLFTGYELSLTELETYNFRTAVAENGVCVYMECLESMTPRPELLRRIHVIPGHIGRGTRMFDSIWDCAPTQVPSLQRVVIQRAVEEQQIAVEPYLPNSLTMTALVDEPSGPGQLSLYYRISTPQEQVLLQPGAVSSCVLQRSGLVLCSKSNCGSGFEANTYFVQSGWRFDTRTLDELPNYNYNWTLGKGAFIWKHISLNVARLLAIALLRQSHFDFRAISHIFLRQDECLPCSVRSALQMVQDLGHAHPTNQQLIHIL
jgi:hypothetical protein